MRLTVAPPPTWPQPLAYPGAPVAYYRAHPVRLGQVVEVAGAAVSAARTGQGFASGSLGFGSTSQALSSTGSIVSTTGALVAVAPVLFGLAPIPVVGWVAAAVGALLMIAGMFGGKPKLSHAQREALEVQRVGGTVGSMLQEIQAASTLEGLWTTLKRWASGYVGGTSSVAVHIYFRAPGGDEGDPAADAAMKPVALALLASGGILLPPGQTREQRVPEVPNAYTGFLGETWIGNQNPHYPVLTQQGFYSLIEQHPDWLRVHVQAGVTPSMLDPINTNVRNTILNALQRLGYRFTPGSGAAQLFGAAAPAPSGPDAAAVSAWVTQAYQQLLGRAPSSTELAGDAAALTAQQVTPTQFLNLIMNSAEFRAKQGTTVGVTPTGSVVITGAPQPTTGQPPGTYWWQNALLRPSGLAPAGTLVGAQPILAASMLPTPGAESTLTPWLTGLGVLSLIGLVLVTLTPPARRRR